MPDLFTEVFQEKLFTSVLKELKVQAGSKVLFRRAFSIQQIQLKESKYAKIRKKFR